MTTLSPSSGLSTATDPLQLIDVELEQLTPVVEIETALEPFRQIANSRGTRGTGLGLPLTKALIDANRASFSIKSKKAEGTLVEVAFPPTRVLAE
jgi:signal transduction histidine kinase